MNLNPITYYRQLIDELETRRINILPLSELKPIQNPTVGIRHDIDRHPQTALLMARYLAMKGIPGSFYVLHTAPYYTTPGFPNILKRLAVTGCEIGLHNDAWYYGEKGPSIIVQELEYLSKLGIPIKGTVAHNSLSTYGASNYEVFKERVLLKRETHLPLGKLSMKALGLTYEGTFAGPKPHTTIHDIEKHLATTSDIQSSEWMNQFLAQNPYCEYSTYAQFWLIGKDEWAAAFNGNLHWRIGLAEVLQLIDELPPKTTSILVIHPNYFETPTDPGIYPDISPPRTRKRWVSRLPQPIKNLGWKILQLRDELTKKRLEWMPKEALWEIAQKNYVEWANTPLFPEYIEEIIIIGKQFADYIGDPEYCLDIGCGNGIIGGKTYDELGYSYLNKTPNSHTIGLDPLPLMAPLPSWLDEYKQGMAEELPFPDNQFDKIIIATSLDHVIDPAQCVRECHRVMKTEGTLFIWTTYKDYIDKYHPHNHEEDSLTSLLNANGFKIEDITPVSDNGQVFIRGGKK